MAKSKLKKRPDGLYQISVVLEVGGKKKRKFFYGHTQQEAKRKMMDWEEAKSRGKAFDAVAEEWASRHWEEIRPGTQVCYSPALKRAKEAFADIPIRAIQPMDIKRTVDRMADQHYGYKSVATYLSVLNQIFRYAITEGETASNPTETITVPKGLHRGKREVPSEDKLEVIRANVDRPFGLFPFMLLYTGMRRGELLALQWRDIDFGNRLIRVSKSVSYAATGNQPEIGETKTEAGKRCVILMERLIPLLWPRVGKPEEYVFGGKCPMTQSVYRSAWRNYCLETGLYDTQQQIVRQRGRAVSREVRVPNITPHQLRHAYATILFEADVDAKDAQQQLGHSRIDVTMDIYTHIRQEHLKDVAEKLNRVM